MLSDNVKNAIIALTVGLLVGALGAWTLTGHLKDLEWQHAIDRQKSEAATELKTLIDKVTIKDKEVLTLKDQLEKNDVRAQQTISSTLANNRRLAAQLGGLRDPGRRAGCPGPMPASPATASSDSTAPSGSQLSEEASQFLLEFAADADRAAQYARTCHDWAVTLPQTYQFPH
jgi:hypothetical protein